MFVESISIKANNEERWPYTIPAFFNLHKIELKKPVTYLVGDNGSGKSTLLESLAIACRMPAIGRSDANLDPSLKHLDQFFRSLKLSRSGRLPKSKFFLRSEDFFSFILRLKEYEQSMKGELERVEREYEGRSAFAKSQARMAFIGDLSRLYADYGKDLLDAASHGEGYMRLFDRRIVPNGLYFLDEPEAALSPLRQMALMTMIHESTKMGSQFIIATHSPIITALPDADILCFDDAPLTHCTYQELDAVRIIKEFTHNPEAYLRHLI